VHSAAHVLLRTLRCGSRKITIFAGCLILN
jgi:hypothetical protein